MVKEIKVYTRPTCAPCKMLKSYLKYKGFSFEEMNVDEDSNAQAEAFSLSGLTMVPVTVVTLDDGNKEIISGYNLSKLSHLANA